MEWLEIVGALAGVITLVIGTAWGFVRSYVKKTEAKWDDKLVKAIEDGINQREK